MDPPYKLTVRMFHGGEFKINTKSKIEYQGGTQKLMADVMSYEMTYTFLNDAAKATMTARDYPLVWYRKVGKCWTYGRILMRDDNDIPEILRSKDKHNGVDLFVTISTFKFVVDPIKSPRSKLPVYWKPPTPVDGPSQSCSPKTKKNTKQTNIVTPLRKSPRNYVSLPLPPANNTVTPLRRSPRNIALKISPIKSVCTKTEHLGEKQTGGESVNKNEKACVKGKDKGKAVESVAVKCVERPSKLSWWKSTVQKYSGVVVDLGRSEAGKSAEHEQVDKNVIKPVDLRKTVKEKVVKSKKIVKEKTVKDKVVKVNKTVKKKVDEGKKPVKSKGGGSTCGKKQGKSKKIKENLELDLNEFSDEDVVDLGSLDDEVEFVVGEEDKTEEDLFDVDQTGSILNQVEKSLVLYNRIPNVEEVREDVFDDEPGDDDDDELRSLEGSDVDDDNAPIFNLSTDFTRNINLILGLKFPSVKVLRKALTNHAIENRYNYYYLHNGRKRVTTYCRKRCDCEWSKIRAKILCDNCKCDPSKICHFKVHARKLKGEETVQIRSMNLKHDCYGEKSNKRVSSEYLSERYLEEWRDNPDWKLYAFQKRIERDLGVQVTYGVCWLARARSKLILYGDGADQYARVWDYVAALRKYNPGSSTFVMVEGIERPPPLFQRMYVCLKARKDGFLAGCRPLIGVDGCHLKGAYTGMCLVVVGKDGNNNLYPVAWAVVEVENMQSWTWFLQLLVEDLGKDEGEGLTFMSDRQKGLLEAFTEVAPKADVRYCVRHIWANFKLQFTGQAFKQAFWSAARTTSKALFDKEMKGIQFLNPRAHAYLAAIPSKHWSRHAFPTTSKSNMLLNNICESFNHVLKEARDKPILTFMEWIRRYVMRRSCEKREGVQGMAGTLMPYAVKYLRWAQEESRFCDLTPSSAELFEVDYYGDTYVVDLNARTCGCYHWDLTGLPCPHAMKCIGRQRGNPEEYVHEAYSKTRYMMSHEPSIAPMPGVQHWKKVDQPEPLPPSYKTMPGRPSLKKRRKEAGEGTSNPLKRPRLPRKCGNCGDLGHTRKRCQNLVLPVELQPPKPPFKAPPREKVDTAWSNKGREQREKKKAAKEDAASMLVCPSQASVSGPSVSQQPNLQSSQGSDVGSQNARQVRRRMHFES